MSAASVDQAERRILVVEDDPVMTEMLSLLLQDSGCTVLTAASAEEALSVAREQTPDVITLDLGLPGMDGQSLLRLLRSDPTTADIAVIVVTGMRFMPSAEDRVSDVLEKPFDAARLETAVLQALGMRPPSQS